MVGVSSNSRVVNPFGLSTGSSSSSPLTTSKPWLRLREAFRSLAPKARPKVVASRLNPSETMLKRTGRQAMLDLKLLARSPPLASGPLRTAPAPQAVAVSSAPPSSGGQTVATTDAATDPKLEAAATPPLPLKSAAYLAVASRHLNTAIAAHREDLDRLKGLQKDLATASPKARPAATAALAEKQRSLGTAIAKALDGVTRLIRETTAEQASTGAPGPRLAAALADLGRVQTELCRQAILAQQPSLDADIPRTVGFHRLRDEVGAIEAAVDGFASGAERIDLSPGLQALLPEGAKAEHVTLPELASLVRAFAQDLARNGHVADTLTARHLTGVAAALDMRLEVAGAAADLAALKTQHPGLDVGGLTRQFRLALPSIDWGGNTGDLARLRMASGALAALAGLVRGGEVPDMLIGTNADLNAALLAVKTEHAADQAERVARARAGGPLTPAETADARASGARIATLRHELTLSNRTLEAHLKTDRRIWYKPSTWGEKGRVFGEGASAVRKDAAFMKALARLGGKEAGRDVLLMIARTSVLETEVITLEKTLLGLHEGFDLGRLAKADPSDPLAYLGLENADLKSIGIDGTAQGSLVAGLREILGKGVADLRMVDQVVDQLNSARETVIRAATIQGTVGDVAGSSVRAVGRSLLTDLLTDAYLQSRKSIDPTALEPGLPAPQAWPLFETMSSLSVATPEIDRLFKGIGAVMRAATQGAVGTALAEGSATYREIEMTIASLAGRRHAAGARLDACKDQIAHAKSLGLTTSEREGLKETRKALRAEIKAFDAEIVLHARSLDAITEKRDRDYGPLTSEAKTLIRTAVLATLPAVGPELAYQAGRLDSQIQPLAQRGAIETMLEKDWGLDIEAFAPEIDSALYGTLGLGDLATWRSEIDFSAKFRAFEGMGLERSRSAGTLAGFGKDAVLGRRDMDSRAKSALRSLLDGLAPDDKISLKAGQRVTFDTKDIPVDPLGIVSLRARLGSSFVDQLAIELGGDGFKLHVRSGFDAKGGLDAMAGKSFAVPGGEAKLQGGGGVEAGGGRMAGWTMKFPNTEKGRERLTALVMKMAENKAIEPADLLVASDIAPSSEQSIKGAIVGKARARIEASIPIVGFGGGAVAEASASLGIGGKQGSSANHKASMTSGEVEVSGTFAIGASSYVKVKQAANLAQGELFKAIGAEDGARRAFGTDSDGDARYGISSPTQRTDLLGASATVTSSYVNKWKHERDENGRYTKAEIVRQTNVNSMLLGAVTLVGTKEVRSRLASDKPEDADFQAKFGALTALMGTNDVLSITYTCSKEQLRRANDLLDEAGGLRKGGDETGARALERLADTIVGDADNHAAAKLALIKTTLDKRDVGVLNMRFVKWEGVSDAKFEHPTATITL